MLVCGLAVLSGDALFVGFVFPCESLTVLPGVVAASRDKVSLLSAVTVVILAVVVGDSVGTRWANTSARSSLSTRLLRCRQKRCRQAQDYLARRGAAAVCLGRWTSFLRAVMPALARSASIPYRAVPDVNAAGGLSWGAEVVTVGYLAGTS